MSSNQPQQQQQQQASKSLCAHYSTLHYDETGHTHPPLNGSLLSQADVVPINGNSRTDRSVTTSAGTVGSDHTTVGDTSDRTLHLISTIKGTAQGLDIFGDSTVMNATNTSGHVHHVHYSDGSVARDDTLHHDHAQQQHLHLITANDLNDPSTTLLMTTNAGTAMLGQYYPLQSFSTTSGSGTTSTSTTGADTSGLFLLDSNASNQTGTLQRSSRIRFSLADGQQNGTPNEDRRVKI